MKNVILIDLDTLRSDHLSCYGYFRKTDPTIREIASEGVLFEEFYASGIPTGSATTSVITGLYPINHDYYYTPAGIPNQPQMNDNIPTMAEIFQENGYQTAAIDNLLNFQSHPKHFARGYEYYMNPTKNPQAVMHEVQGEKVNEKAKSWIKKHSKEPFFLFIHYWDPHTPYNQPEAYKNIWEHEVGSRKDLDIQSAEAGYDFVPGWGMVNEMSEKTRTSYGSKVSMDLYDGEIKYVDDKIKEIVDLLERKGLMKNSTLALFGDHGEGLGQHGLWDHFGLHDSIVHVPLIIRDRGLSSGKRISDICTQADLLPTLMDLSGISDIPDFWGDTWPRSTDEFDGVSLTKVLKGNVKRNNIFLEGNRENARGMRTQNWKFINHAFEKTELFNVADDPMEKYDLSEENSEKADHMKNKLLEWMKKNGASRRQIVLMTKDRPRRSCPKSHYVH